MSSSPSSSKRFGLLISNLGSPESPHSSDVKSFLNQFLNDPFVINLPWFIRYPLVQGVLIPSRLKKSSEAYSKIWTQEGSPLTLHTRKLASKLRATLHCPVEYSMRFGSPSIESGLDRLVNQAVNHVIFLPLFPQYSFSATESALVEFERCLKKYHGRIGGTMIESFYQNDRFIASVCEKIKTGMDTFQPDVLLLSYHGIPEKQLSKPKNGSNYQNQCFETSQLIREKLNLAENQVVTSFQSRVGPVQWIKPHTDEVLKDLIKADKKRVLVAAPSFTADCLETLEEIQIQYQDLFLKSGGEEFRYIQCVNSSDLFVSAIDEIIKPYTVTTNMPQNK